jgi:translation initiation factor 3 subunit M
MDQANNKVHISSTMHRTFGRAQWQQLRDLLNSWKTNLILVQENMKQTVTAQAEIGAKN